MPSEGLIVKKSWFMGPRTSSTLPTAVCWIVESMVSHGLKVQRGKRAYLVLEVDGCVEVGDLGVGGLDNHLALAGVDELAHLEHGSRRAHVAILETAAETAAS